jgi:hypothetical protein
MPCHGCPWEFKANYKILKEICENDKMQIIPSSLRNKMVQLTTEQS